MCRARCVVSLLLLFACGDRSNHDRLVEHIETLHISIALYPFDASRAADADPGTGLRSVLLHQGLLIPPPVHGPEGPVMADAMLTQEALLAIVEELEGLGVWKDARLYYSPARVDPSSDPPSGERYRGHTTTAPSCRIRAGYTSGEWNSSVIATVPWGVRTVTVLRGLRRHIPAPLVDQLLATCHRFQ
jgi:hypothetical protein